MDEKDNEALGRLIFKIAGGDRDAVRELYERAGKVMTAVAAVYLADPFDVEETVEDALLAVVRKADRFRENKNACAWLNAIVMNLAKDRLRKNARRKEVSLDAAAERGAEQDEEGIFVREMLSALGEKEREAVIFKYWYGFSLAEIARAMKRSKSGAKSLLDRAEEKLRKKFS